MRKLLLFALLICTVLISNSCSKDNVEVENTPPLIPTIEISNEATQITLPETSTGTATFSFTCNTAWQIATSETRATPSWFDVYPKSGGAGTQTLTVSIKEENPGYDDRNGYIKILCGDVQQYITVTQKKKDALLITASRYDVPTVGGEIEVEVKANIDFTVDVKDAEWIHRVETRGLTTTNLRFEVEESEESTPREGQIVITGGGLTETVTVYQAGSEVLVLTQSEYVVSDDGATIQVELRTNAEYTVELPDVDWIKESTTRGISSFTKYYEIKPNETYDSRTATIVISTATKREEVAVYQVQKDAIIVAKSEYTFDYKAASLDFDVQHNVDFDIAIDESARSWITQVETRGLKTTTLHFDVAINSGDDDRTGAIVVSKGSLKQTITVKQAGCEVLVLTQKEYTISDAGATIQVELQSNTDFTVALPDVDWIQETTTRGTSTYTKTYEIAANETHDSRTAIIVFSTATKREEVSITQVQKDAIIVAKSEYTFDHDGGVLDFDVQHNVDLDVDIDESAKDWIKKVTTRGLKLTRLHFDVEANADDSERTGTIIVSKGSLKQTVTVKQSGNGALILTQKEYTVSDAGEIIQVDLQTNTEYSVRLPDVDWIQETTTRGMSTYTKYYEIAPNEAYESRTATIVFSIASKQEEVVITQVQKDAIIVAKSEYEFAYEGGALDFDVQHNIDFDVTIEGDSKSWITQITTRNLKATSLHFDVLANVDENERTGRIVVLNGERKQTITVKQGGSNVLKLKKERDALIAIYNATGGANWKNKTNWCSDKPVGEWFGVGTDSDGSVYNLSLPENNLKGSVPAEISDLVELRELSLGGVSIPTEINNCTKLTQIELFQGELPNEIYNLPNLERLAAVALRGTMPTRVENLENLKTLRIDGSLGMTGTIPSSIGDFTNLEYVEFNWCSFIGPIPTGIGRLNKLEALLIVNCGVSGTIPAEIGNCRQLRDVNISQNNLTGTIPESLGALPNLKYFVSYNNKLSGKIPQTLLQNKTCWDRCWALIMLGNNLDSATVNAINFSAIDLSGNAVVAADEYANNTYTALLQFSGGLSHFANIESLKKIYNTYKDKGFDIIGYSSTVNGYDTPESIRNFVSSNNIPWRNIAWTDNNRIVEIADDWSFGIYYPYHSYPFISVVDPDGKVVFYSDYKDQNFVGLDRFLDQNLGGGNLPTFYTSTDYSADGRVTTLQKASAGNGIDIVLMGDAFSDRLIADGTYEQTMLKAMDKFFSEEPYKTYRHLFNVYMVELVSDNEVYDPYSITALGGYFGAGTQVGGSDGKCFTYAQNAISADRMDDALIVVMMNSDNYAGTCYMYYPADSDYGRGASIAYFPLGTDDAMFEGLLHHEAGGHGFAKLADEYAYESMGAIPDGDIAYYNQLGAYGWWKNADFTNDLSQVKWAKFLTDNRYAQDGLGVYEGALTYWTGAYRPTENSIMRYNTGGFNAPSREAIYYRIHKLAYGASWMYNHEDFVAYDAVNRTVAAAAARRAQISKSALRIKKFKPQTPPVVIKHSWRDAKK